MTKLCCTNILTVDNKNKKLIELRCDNQIKRSCDILTELYYDTLISCDILNELLIERCYMNYVKSSIRECHTSNTATRSFVVKPFDVIYE